MEAKYKVGDYVARHYPIEDSLGDPNRIVDVYYSQTSRNYVYLTEYGLYFKEDETVGITNYKRE